MVAVMLIGIVLIAGLWVLAYTLAVYALPFMLGVTAAQFAYHTGAGFIGGALSASPPPSLPSAFSRCCSTRYARRSGA